MAGNRTITLHAPSTHADKLSDILDMLRDLGLDPIVLTYEAFGDMPEVRAPGLGEHIHYGQWNLSNLKFLELLDLGITLFRHEHKTTGHRTLIRIIDDWAFIVYHQNYQAVGGTYFATSSPIKGDPDVEVVDRYHFVTMPVLELRKAMTTVVPRVGRYVDSILRDLIVSDSGGEPKVESILLNTWPEAVARIGWDGQTPSKPLM